MKVVVAIIVAVALAIGGWFVFAGRGLPEADFRVGSAVEVDTLDPQKCSWSSDLRLCECLYETLLKTKVDGGIEGGSADKWQVSDDGLTYTFHIRNDAKWSNGDPVTAHDFVYAWQRAMLPDNASQYTNLMFFIKGARAFHEKRIADLKAYRQNEQNHSIERAEAVWAQTQKHFQQTVGLKAVDDHTLKVTLERPTHYFPEIVAFGTYSPVHRRSAESRVSYDNGTGFRQTDVTYWADPHVLVTNGPYTLAERRFKEYTYLKQNPYFWNRDQMGNKSILIRIIPQENTMVLEFNNGNIDWTEDIPTSAKVAADLAQQMRNGERNDVVVSLGAGTYFYDFNCQPKIDGRDNPLADPRVRRAMSMAIDRKAIVEKVTRLHQPVALTFTPPDTIEGYDPPVEAGVKYDPDAARALLAKAGYPNGQGMPAMMFLYNTGFRHEEIAQAVINSWKEVLGLDVQMKGLEKNTFMEARRSHKFDIARDGWYGDYADPTTFLHHHRSDDEHNNAGYASAEYDALIKQADAETDPVKRYALLRQAEAVMLHDQPVAPIYQYVSLHLFDPDKVTGIVPNPWNHRRLEFVHVKGRGEQSK